MILVCVGASEYPFDRMLRMMDELCERGVIRGEDIIAQTGVATYRPQYYRSFSLIGREEFQRYMQEADVVITHAGTGSVLPPLKLGKKVIIIPRKASLGEHIDDHQQELVDVFARAGYAQSADTVEELKACIENMDDFQAVHFESNNARMCNMIIDFIEHN